MFEHLRLMHRLVALPSRQTCKAAVLVIADRQPDLQRELDRIAQQRERQP